MIKPGGIDRVVSFLARLQEPFYTFDGGEYSLSPALRELTQEIYDSGLTLDFNWPDWQANARRYFEDPELLKAANLEIIRKLLTTHVRKERFSEGHLPQMCASGHLQAVLARLKELQESGRDRLP